MKSVALLALPLSLVACYGSAPPKPPKIPLPPMQEGAMIDVHSDTRTSYENVDKTSSTCPQGKSEGDPSCVVTHYNVTEPVTRTTTTASYADQPISYAQFKVMTDPHYDDKLVQLQDLSHKCQRANIPRYAGLGMMLGGLITGLVVGGTTGEIIMYGGLGGGGVAYGVGYFGYGGRQCNEARAIYNDVNVADAMSWQTVEGADYATEMKVLADQFNQAHAHATAAQSDDTPPAPGARMRMRH
jgi:hypothetical protein